MISGNLEAIERLRETRERSALAELEGRNRARDLAEARAATFEQTLQMQTKSIKAEQTQLYNDMVGQQVAAGDLDKIRTRVDSGNAELSVLSEQNAKAQDAVAAASAEAHHARIKHSQFHRALQKWAALRRLEAEKLQKAEAHREELRIEESLHNRREHR